MSPLYCGTGCVNPFSREVCTSRVFADWGGASVAPKMCGEIYSHTPELGCPKKLGSGWSAGRGSSTEWYTGLLLRGGGSVLKSRSSFAPRNFRTSYSDGIRELNKPRRQNFRILASGYQFGSVQLESSPGVRLLISRELLYPGTRRYIICTPRASKE